MRLKENERFGDARFTFPVPYLKTQWVSVRNKD